MNNRAFSSLCDSLADHRVVTAERLTANGADRNAILRARNNGSLQSVPGIDGVYVVGKLPYDELVFMHAAVAHAGGRAVVTGLWGARLLRLRWVPEGGLCLLRVPDGCHRRSAGRVLLSRTDDFDRVETWEHEGLLVAGPAQAVADACRQIPSDPETRHPKRPALDLRDVRGVVLGAVAGGRCSIAELESVLSRGSIRWTKHLRRALLDAERGAASPPEAELVDGLLPYGVPFYCNVEVWVDDDLIGVLDILLLGTGVGAELDSVEVHAADALLNRTTERDDVFKGIGLDLRHRTPTAYRADPDAFHRRLLEAAAARLAKGLGDPAHVRLVPRGPLLCGPVSERTPYVVPGLALPPAA